MRKASRSASASGRAAAAIVRHRGALSLVVPRFGANTTIANFRDQIVAYRLSDDDRWVVIPDEAIPQAIELT